MEKDWTGNKKTTFSTLGASSHSKHDREINDYYATDPSTIESLFQKINFSDTIWECACGEGHLSEAIKEYGKSVFSTDLIDRGYGNGQIDFLETDIAWNGDIITNPPYKYAKQFIQKSLDIINKSENCDLKIAMFLKLTFLEGQNRKKFFQENPPRYVLVYSKRQKCALNGEFDKLGSSAVCYAWFVWEKGFEGNPTIMWI